MAPQKFGQRQLYIPYIDKYRQENCCLDKCYHDTWNLFLMFPGTFLSSLVKIGSVTGKSLWLSLHGLYGLKLSLHGLYGGG